MGGAWAIDTPAAGIQDQNFPRVKFAEPKPEEEEEGHVLMKEYSQDKKLSRSFTLEISNSLRECKKWAEDVIQGIENDQLLVVDADKIISLDEYDGFIQIDSSFNEPVSIREWLPVACQSIRCQDRRSDDFDRPNAIACYKSNAEDVLFPIGADSMSPGPAAFYGAIIFERDFVSALSMDSKGEDKFRFALAHELVHVFDFMRLLVPAFQNWRRFWEICLDEGCACEETEQLWMYRNIFIDSYGSEDDFLKVKEFWPHTANKWFDAFRS